MTYHLGGVPAKAGDGSTLTGGAKFNDESGTGDGPYDQAVVLIDDAQHGATIKPASTAPIATDTALVVALSPNGQNTNGRKTPANSTPVVLASQIANTIAASQSAQALTGGGGGATGDWLDGVLIVPASTSPGAVSVTDGSGSAVTVFAGGASSVSNLVPFFVPYPAASQSGAWKVTTGSSVSAVAFGNFT